MTSIQGQDDNQFLCSCTFVNPIELCTMSIGLLIQCGVSVWSFLTNLQWIPTWGSNPLNTTLSALHRGTVQHRSNRCMALFDNSNLIGTLRRPTVSQSSPRQVHPNILGVMVFVWALGILRHQPLPLCSRFLEPEQIPLTPYVRRPTTIVTTAATG